MHRAFGGVALANAQFKAALFVTMHTDKFAGVCSVINIRLTLIKQIGRDPHALLKTQ